MSTFSSNGATITLKRSLRREILFRRLRETVGADETLFDHTERFQFAFVAAFVDTVEGMKWTPPQMGMSEKAIEKSFQEFQDAVPDYDFFNELMDAVTALRSPVADVVQRPDDTLTEAEKADPNS